MTREKCRKTTRNWNGKKASWSDEEIEYCPSLCMCEKCLILRESCYYECGCEKCRRLKGNKYSYPCKCERCVKIKGACSYPCTLQKQDQSNVQTPIQVGPLQDQEQVQNATQNGAEQNQGQEQNTNQIPTQEGAVVDQEQNTTQNPVITGPSPEQAVTQNSNPQTDTITTQTSTTSPTQTSNQNPTQTQEGLTQTQDEEQTQTLGDQLQLQRHGDQAQGPQTITGHTNTSPLNNTQTISTPTTVSGVTLTVPVTVYCGCDEKDNYTSSKKCNNDRNCFQDCDCCEASLADLLRRIQTIQSTIVLPRDKAINLYVNTMNVASNLISNQVITNVNNCSTVTFKNVDQLTNVPRTTFQLNKVSGISVTNNPASSTDVFDFLLAYANSCDSKPPEDYSNLYNCGCEGNYSNSCCCKTLEAELQAAANFGLSLIPLINGGIPLPTSVFVYRVCGCLVFFVDNLVAPTVIYAFSLCSINGITVPPQTLA
ncbi:hypothetical protein [Priestia flexa]|uniref:hypothetical protein n=1 Tax=Priestia flexa TaxID=86664 RepID=UPI001B321112|nr:hypothetical protein [Priestia flexa]